ncbi:NAD(P)H-hydrate epimerase, partial [Escherichia coli]|uniref:NAD(P)H-hydrate epimerase n=1 Tax=Escherichia coli TaxID=562 RepID=UPI001BC897BE
HANRIWIACGPGNNGGDGLQAAAWLQQHLNTMPARSRNCRILVSCVRERERMPADAHANRIWIACGPGNNGGDGLQAAAWLQQHLNTMP